MDSLSALNDLLDIDDKRQFKAFLQRKNKRADVKNLDLLKFIETDDINHKNKLYNGQKNSDAYHALRKRLQDNLLLFLSQKTFEDDSSDTYDSLRLVVVGRFLLENDLTRLGFKCLNKAEKLAEHLEQFNLLNELLSLKIQYAHLHGAERFEDLIERFNLNQTNMQREAKLNMAYAYLRTELQEIHLKGKVVDLTELMVTSIKNYQISTKDLQTYRSVYQILLIANEYAAINHNYGLITKFIAAAENFISQKANQKPYLFYYLSILYLLANYHLRTQVFKTSASYLEDMMCLMLTDTRFYWVFYLRYQLLHALNLFYTGFAEDAIFTLEQSLRKNRQTFKQEDIEDHRLCLTMFWALCGNKRCVKQLSHFNHTDARYEKKMGMLWTIRKNLMEILIWAQFDEIDPATSRLQSFKRRYKKYLLQTSEERVIIFIKLVEKYLTNPDVVSEAAYKKDVMQLLQNEQKSDLFTTGFVAWLIARIEKRSAYDVLLSIIQGNQLHE
ncbi:hypothetical protein FPZ42_02805 [Mucilaginibacter achroorhodeus]|uniref:Uncharacterized protein n=1 Tax=Mucilaginibacter achroorhodeus TaxID=2599294 RepID=A0A563UA02_9SPHI|nr:hypothetical protein [Mucilaginibacter achroorhodeus]TWR28160.1 hypothetical protein FPZ42_02805 [Mucilaginibacter achroorhodeus]